jgi:methyltransferase (TIGR00027 family)
LQATGGAPAYTVKSKAWNQPEVKIMSKRDSGVRDISDTARWVAYFRARETQRPDALFRDPYAEKLAGERGFQIAHSLQDGTKHEWAWAARIYLFDQFVAREIRLGTELIVNLAAGLDTRPYRLELPPTLHWVEVDVPRVISYKQEILKCEKPLCHLEQIPLDLSDLLSRRKLLQQLNASKKRICVMTEGLLIYFTNDQVASLAEDLARDLRADKWITDLCSPGQLKIMQGTSGKQLRKVNAAFKFAPEEGPGFFVQYGWQPMDVQGFLKTAARLNRAPAELLSLLPEPERIQGNYPWTGVCLLNRR